MARRAFMLLVFTVFVFAAAHAQWQVQDSHTTANLRGIHAVDARVAWASGADGTVLRTVDGGLHWQRCDTPPGADKLDFRGIWAWDANTATVMSAGPGDLSRVYRTTDGCLHWSEKIANSEKDGFWDAVVFQTRDFGFGIGNAQTGVLLGDPIRGRFDTKVKLLGYGWFIDENSCQAQAGESAFAASNSSVIVFGSRRYILVTGGKGGPRALISPLLAHNDAKNGCLAAPLPLASGNDSSGAFSVAFRDLKHGVVVGGDYKKPEASSGTAAWTIDGGRHWTAASKPPHGYRSSVAWDADAKVWIAVGTNGSDFSRDDGKTWQRLDNGNWNAVSLPFAVGPNGRIARLSAEALRANQDSKYRRSH